jgi:hypothetical protein
MVKNVVLFHPKKTDAVVLAQMLANFGFEVPKRKNRPRYHGAGIANGEKLFNKFQINRVSHKKTCPLYSILTAFKVFTLKNLRKFQRPDFGQKKTPHCKQWGG